MKIYLTGHLALIITLLMLGVRFVSADAEKKNIPRIGYLTDTAGPGGFFGVPATIGALLAQRDLAKAGNPIEIIFEETANQPANGVSAVMKLINIDKVDGIMSDLTAVSVPIAPRTATAKLPLIYQSPARSIASQHTGVFKNFIDYQDGCATIARFWKKENKRVAVVAPHLEFGELCYQGAKSEVPDIVEYRYNSGDDFRAVVTRFMDKKVDALVLVGVESDMISFYQYARSQSFFPQYGLINIMSDKVAKIGGEALSNAILIDFLNPTPDFMQRIALFDPRIKLYAIAPAALAYNGIIALAKAIRTCAKGDYECHQKSLRSPPVSQLLGFTGWGENRDPYPLRLIPFAERLWMRHADPAWN